MSTTKIEVLSPAGGYDSVSPAVISGADAIYIGAETFSARSSAKNFSLEEIKKTIEYCHIRNVKVYLAANTIVFDHELKSALKLVKEVAKLNIDGVIVQDIGFAMLIHEMIPELPLHGSTQMSIHTPSGAKALYEMGFKRVVLARELNKKEIKEIVKSCPIETEVFVHGALCMSVSGQCYFSAMLGSRSGNRGSCAQTCRLPFNVKGGNGFALSLKDNSLIDYLNELEEMGVTSAKIEGRMKRPEYVAAATKACREKVDLGYVLNNTQKKLENVFSRTGFTDGYYTNNLGKDMFGTREKEDVVSATEKLFESIRESYNKEIKKADLSFYLKAYIGKEPTLKVSDGENKVKVNLKKLCEKAINRSLTKEICINQLSKMGNTPYNIKEIKCDIEKDVMMSFSDLNKLRRQAVNEITNKRLKKYNYNYKTVNIKKEIETLLSVPYRKGKKLQKRSVFENKNLSITKTFKNNEYIFIDLFLKDIKIKELLSKKYNIAVNIPKCMFGKEKEVINRLKDLKKLGINHVLASNIGAVYLAKELGFIIHGGFGLNITNTASLIWAEKYGLKDVELSLEITMNEIEKLGGNIKRGIASFGYLPLMLTRNCPLKSGNINCETCKNSNKLKDRKNIEFTTYCGYTCTHILNSVPLVIEEKNINKLLTDFQVFHLYVDNYVERVDNYSELTLNNQDFEDFTKGLYYRGVR